MNRKLSAVLLGGLVGGAFDITYAISYSYFRSGVEPTRLLQYVASGLLGSDAFAGGTPIAALGLGLHFLMVLVMAAVYVSAAGSLPFLVRRPILSGAIYGAGLFAFMNLVVLPLSNVPPRTAAPAMLTIVTGLLVHMFLVGVPIALAARRAVVPAAVVHSAATA